MHVLHFLGAQKRFPISKDLRSEKLLDHTKQKKKKNKNGRFLGMALHFLWYPVRVDVQNIVKYSKSSDNIVSL